MYVAQKLVHSRSSMTLVQKFFIDFCLNMDAYIVIKQFLKDNKMFTFLFYQVKILQFWDIDSFGNVEIAFDNKTPIKNRIIM